MRTWKHTPPPTSPRRPAIAAPAQASPTTRPAPLNTALRPPFWDEGLALAAAVCLVAGAVTRLRSGASATVRRPPVAGATEHVSGVSGAGRLCARGTNGPNPPANVAWSPARSCAAPHPGAAPSHSPTAALLSADPEGPSESPCRDCDADRPLSTAPRPRPAPRAPGLDHPRRAALLALTHSFASAAAGPALAKRPPALPSYAVVTGACGGIGGAIAEGLALRGYDVIPACRTVAAAAAAAARLRAAQPGAHVTVLDAPCDLADLRSVAGFAAAVAAQCAAAGGAPVRALALAAGVVSAPLGPKGPGRTAQGHEPNYGVNHLGHFALTSALLPQLRAAGPTGGARVVALTSTAAYDAPAELPLADLDWRARPHSPRGAYCESKACNVLFCDELARREAVAGSRVAAFSLHPGPALTLAVRYELPKRYEQRRTMSQAQLERQAAQLNLRMPREAAQGALWLLDTPEVQDGGWYVDPALLADDVPWRTPQAAAALWQLSEQQLREGMEDQA